MRTVLAVLLSMFAVACGGNPVARLTPDIELDVTVIDSADRPIEGAEVILHSEPVSRHLTTGTSGAGRFVGLFIVDPRFFIVCAPGFICSEWLDMQAAGIGSMKVTVTLQQAPIAVPRLLSDRP